MDYQLTQRPQFMSEHITLDSPSQPAAHDTRHNYTAYGLSISSDLALPDLEVQRQPNEPDIVIRQQAISHPLPPDSAEPGCYESTDDEAFVHYDEVGQLHIRHGREILLDPNPDGTRRLQRHIVQGMAMGILLHQRGHLTLHASGVAIQNHVAGFIGWKRMGKSTTAAALYASGHRLLTDDTIVIDNTRGSTTVLPGFPQIRLDPEAAVAGLGLDPDDMPRVHPDFEKRLGRADADFSLKPLPLGAIFSLNWGEEFEVEQMSQRDALVELIRHSYAQRFLGNAGATPQHLEQVQFLAQNIPVYELTKPRELERLPELVELIRNHMPA